MMSCEVIITFILQETYPSTPPVWFAESEETSVTNAVQILSNTTGRDNHVINQVGILLKELCRLHSLPEPPDVERLRTALDRSIWKLCYSTCSWCV